MMKPKLTKTALWKYAGALTAFAVLFSACGNGDGAGETAQTPPAATEPGAETPPADPATEGGAEAPGDAAGDDATDANVEAPVDAADLPQTKTLEFDIEGEPQSESAQLTISELGYALYVLEEFEFTPEEPGKDLVFHQRFPEFSMRIETLPDDASVEEARAAAEEALKAVSADVVDMKDQFFDESIRERAAFILHASNEQGSVNAIGMNVGGKLLRFTLRFPLSEAAEGVSPRFYPMLESVVATKE